MWIDRVIVEFDTALRTLLSVPTADRPVPTAALATQALATEDKLRAGRLMRVNHVGEVCAQALYQAQALTTKNDSLRLRFQQAAREERDHLAWTGERLAELNTHRSWLNPIWYGGSFFIGALAGCAGDAMSLGFMAETERQVERHLSAHLNDLPTADFRSRAIVAQMKLDEANHAAAALADGGIDLPKPIKKLMAMTAKVMTTTAYFL